MKKIKSIIIALSLIITAPAFADVKSNDVLIINKTKYEMYSDPIEQLMTKKSFINKVKVATGCNSGFINHAIKYEYKNKQLFVAKIYHALGENCKRDRGVIAADNFFGAEAKYPVKATWFNGKLNFGEPTGKIGNMRKLPKLHTLKFKEGNYAK